MQNLNDLNKMQQVQKEQVLQQVQNLESAGQPAPSKFSRFANIVWFMIFISFIVVISYIVISDNIKTKKQIKANAEAALNTPKIQEYRAKEARRQRDLAKQRRLRKLGIDGVTEPAQKNDLLNEQLRKKELAEQQERLASQVPEGVDYTSELAAYNARLKEVKAQKARRKAQEGK